MAKAFTVELNNGRKMPVLGLGTYSREGVGGIQKAVEAAFSCGYRHVDTASFYDNEEEIGEGIKNSIQQNVVKREEIFITTKLWNDCHAKNDVVPSLKESLKKLGLDYVDLYLIHWPLATNVTGASIDVDYLETWEGMEECLKLGLAKSIGVSNFNINQLDRLLKSCKTKPVVNQVEANVNLTQKPLLEYCKSKEIVITAYSPFGSLPDFRPKQNAPPPRTDDPILTKIGNKYGKTTTQIVLRYLVDCGMIPIPKSITPSRIQENIDIFDFNLTPEEIQTIDKFNCDFRVVPVVGWKNYKNYPF